MLDQTSPSQQTHEISGAIDSVQDVQGESILTVLWRFKWLLGVFLAAGTGVGYWIYKQKPTTYRATTQLMFKSDTPLTLDAASGSIRGGIPSGNLMQSLITSDGIVSRVASHHELKSIPSMQGKDAKSVASMIRKGIKFQTLTDVSDSRDRMIAALHFDGPDPQVCVAVVNAASEAIGEHFEAERESTINEFSRLIDDAQQKLLPQQRMLEEEYKSFRENARLEWNLEGQAINPHREQQFRLQAHRTELQQRMRQINSELRFATSTFKRHDDPVLVAQIIGQMGSDNDGFDFVSRVDQSPNPVPGDLELQKIEIERSLIPLEIKREQLELAYGESHPEVKSITMQIDSSQKKLNELSERISQRRAELNAQSSRTDLGAEAQKARTEHAREIVEAHIRGLQERLLVMQDDLSQLDDQIAVEKRAADELKEQEQNDASYRRRIESIRGMTIQLEQQMSALKLVDVNGGIIVEPLLSTGQAYVTGPDLKRDLILYGMLGLGASGLLALLFEASAKMFRSAEEIQRELRLPVLTHIPLDEGPVRPAAGTVAPEIAELDPQLSVVHRPYSPASEAVRAVRTAMLFDHRQYDSRVFQVTSPLPGDGKSTLAANVGCSIAQSGKKTLLLDLDLRSPRMSLRFNLESGKGLTNVLNGEMDVTEAIHTTPIENLDILPCGPLPANPAEALTLAELGEVLAWARKHYDFVIVDTPPLLMVSDPAVVTSYVDAAMLVLRIRRRCKPNAKEAVAMLRSAGARVMGVVVNKMDEISGGASYKSSASGSYQSIGYGYGDKYRRRYQQEAKVQDTYVVKGKVASEPAEVRRPARNGKPVASTVAGDPVQASRGPAPLAPPVLTERHSTPTHH
ncbi:polysaccharide biosynthesis tyrosine autokinase [Roseiconus nitratireducens]|uniref:non-specific protein-tyrosine kinase n=1 Tax=Roseiconus nitratireducens TaxID=2605748 RepID=A0A5M6D8H8_9BACT|nr:polysaccharide biosynthesis tyrosine autokinase [Roseiconus nitratireducens]KAA5543831.1 polysaccharide biosynthesis tyrosine autokinase [Roseiconus nitratireducens]